MLPAKQSTRKALVLFKLQLLSFFIICVILSLNILNVCTTTLDNFDIDNSPLDSSGLKTNPYHWSEEMLVSENDHNNSYDPDMAIDSQDNIHIVWWDNRIGYNIHGNIFTTSDIYYREYLSVEEVWLDAVAISDCSDNIDAIYPKIAVDSQDNIHIVWWERKNDTTSHLLYRIREDNIWGEAIEVIESSDTKEVVIIALENDNLLFLYNNNDLDRYLNLFYKVYEIDNVTFTEEYQLTNSSYFSVCPDVTVDSKNNIHLIWCDKGENYNCSEAYYMQFFIGDILPSNITLLSNDDGIGTLHTTIHLDILENIHIAWVDTSNNLELYYRYYTNGLWNPITSINNKENSATRPTLCSDKENNLHFIWQENLELMHQIKYNTSEWSKRKTIPTNQFILVNANLVCDSDDNLYLLWEGYIGPWEVLIKKGVDIHNYQMMKILLFVIPSIHLLLITIVTFSFIMKKKKCL